MNYILRLLISAAVTIGISYVLPGVHVASFMAALLFAFILSLLNITIKPILNILGLPITFLTFGLFSIVITTIVVILAANFSNGVTFNGFFTALLFSILLSLGTSLLYSITDTK